MPLFLTIPPQEIRIFNPRRRVRIKRGFHFCERLQFGVALGPVERIVGLFDGLADRLTRPPAQLTIRHFRSFFPSRISSPSTHAPLLRVSRWDRRYPPLMVLY